MLVRTEMVERNPHPATVVRAHTPAGVATVLWGGGREEAEGTHVVEWTVDEDLRWGCNARPAALAEPGLRDEGDRVVLRGRLSPTEDGAAYLHVGDAPILFDLASPLPAEAHGTWVEVAVGAGSVSLHPCRT
ncbi:hypothetical protein ACFVU3_19770 [Streptomyces sp. NPDC058052]|uniref:hypothetical protein n=1 Tax=Streptomyces sp. NPDC058052 TaxID=3346316 RepID=UPI0036ED8691